MWKQYSTKELNRQLLPSLHCKLPHEETMEQYIRISTEGMMNHFMGHTFLGALNGPLLILQAFKLCVLQVMNFSREH